MREELKDLTIKKAKPAKRAYEILDTNVRGLGIRIHPSGTKSFILFKRFPGSSNPVRRTIGHYEELVDSDEGEVKLTLEVARDIARRWNKLLKKGRDPKVEEARQHQAEIEEEKRRQKHVFGAALDAYIKHKSTLRSICQFENEMRREYEGWMVKPLADITPDDIKAKIKTIVSRGKKGQAHLIFAFTRTFFNWVVDSGDYGIKDSPVAKLKPKAIIGDPNTRQRTLTDDEIAAFWRACEAIGYPYGKLFQVLALTATRRDEAGEASWSEINLEAKEWTIPGKRMKGGAPHIVPLTKDIMQLLESLPRFKDGDYLFSVAGGVKAVTGHSTSKRRLDALMTKDLEARGKTLEPWVFHDLRRTARTKFSALRIQTEVAEALLAHAKPGIHKVYNQHAYLDEKREALQIWHRNLQTICITDNYHEGV